MTNDEFQMTSGAVASRIIRISAFVIRNHHADVAQVLAHVHRAARSALAARQCLRRLHFSFEGRKRIEKFLRRSVVVRTTRERLLSAIFLRPFAPVAQVSARRASNAEVAGEIPAGSTNSWACG